MDNIAGHHTNLLYFFLTYCPEENFAEMLPPLYASEHLLKNIKINLKPKVSSNDSFHEMIF